MTIDDLQIIAHAIAWIAISFCLCLFAWEKYSRYKDETKHKKGRK